MRKVFVLALASSAVACGGFLGFGGDDDEPAPPAPTEAGADALGADVTAPPQDGGSDTPPQCTTKTLVFGTADGIAGADWSKGTLRGNGTLTVAGGALVSASGAATVDVSEATIFATRTVDVRSIRCSGRVAVSTFTGNGRILQFRIEGPNWSGFWETRIDWVDGKLRAPYQALPDGGTAIELFPSVDAPSPNVVHELVTQLVLGDTPSFTMSFGTATQQTTPPATGPITRAQVVVGTFATLPYETHEVRYESLTCEMCLAQ